MTSSTIAPNMYSFGKKLGHTSTTAITVAVIGFNLCKPHF